MALPVGRDACSAIDDCDCMSAPGTGPPVRNALEDGTPDFRALTLRASGGRSTFNL